MQSEENTYNGADINVPLLSLGSVLAVPSVPSVPASTGGGSSGSSSVTGSGGGSVTSSSTTLGDGDTVTEVTCGLESDQTGLAVATSASGTGGHLNGDLLASSSLRSLYLQHG